MKRTGSGAIEILRYRLLIIGMVNILLLSHIMGVQGVGYLGISLAFLTFGLSFHALWLSGFVTRFVKGRNARNQFKSSEKFFRGALLYALITGLILGLVFAFCRNIFSSYFIRDIHLGICLFPAALILIFYALSEAIGGYLKGMGIARPVKIYMIVRQLVVLGASILGMRLFMQYGEKVAKLKHNEAVASVYGAFGAMIGVLTGVFAGFLVLFVFCALLRGELKRLCGKDTARYSETVREGFWTTLTKGMISGVRLLFLFSVPLVNYILYVRICKMDIASTAWIKTGGYLFGGAVPVLTVLVLFFVILNHKNYRGLSGYFRNEDYVHIRVRGQAMILGAFTTGLPICLTFAVLSEPVSKLIFGAKTEEGANIIMMACTAAAFVILEIILLKLLAIWNENAYSMLTIFFSFVIQTVCVVVLLKGMDMEVMGIMIGILLQPVSAICICLLKLWKQMRFPGYFWKKVIMTAIIVLGCVLVELLLYQFAGANLPAPAAICISVIPGAILYLAVMTVLRIVMVEEAAFMPGGGLFLQLGRMLRRE